MQLWVSNMVYIYFCKNMLFSIAFSLDLSLQCAYKPCVFRNYIYFISLHTKIGTQKGEKNYKTSHLFQSSLLSKSQSSVQKILCLSSVQALQCRLYMLVLEKRCWFVLLLQAIDLFWVLLIV